jgi:predicted dehydrogenase
VAANPLRIGIVGCGDVASRHYFPALAELAPDGRETGRERVARQLGNHYQIESLVLGAPSLADRLLGRPRPAAWAVVAAEIRPAVGERWKSSSTADLVERDGRWYLAGPLFA